MNASDFRHLQIDVDGLSTHVAEGRTAGAPAVLFLHDWPENWLAFESVMMHLSASAHVFAVDLPGIDKSTTPARANDKLSLARHVKSVIDTLGLKEVTLVGHDASGMIVYAFLHAFPNALRRAIIMNVAIPSVPPWDDVVRNPLIFHFTFHAIPELPEALVRGKEASYFGFFYDVITANPERISETRRAEYVAAYRTPSALKTGFDWYRAFAQDAEDNKAVKGDTVETPVLYIRGDHEGGNLADYLNGLTKNGLTNVSGHIIDDSGHFTSDEQPEAVAKLIANFIRDSHMNA